MMVEGALAWLFPGREMAWEEFSATVAGKLILVGLVKPDLDLAGAAIVWNTEGERGTRKAEVGFVFFRRYWATRLIREMAQVAISLVYDQTGADRLVGSMLVENLPARAFSKQMGFSELAVLSRWVPTAEGFRDAVVVAQDREIAERDDSAC
jgi:RimJ/RimL family protein N-acetyltransferase